VAPNLEHEEVAGCVHQSISYTKRGGGERRWVWCWRWRRETETLQMIVHSLSLPLSPVSPVSLSLSQLTESNGRTLLRGNSCQK
jgi:hypothetical protein